MAITIESVSTDGENSSTTSHTVNLPSGITNGDLLIMLVCNDGNEEVTAGTLFTDWTSVLGPLGSAIGVEVFGKDATGSEGSTVDFTTGDSENSAIVCLRLSGHDTDLSTSIPAANKSLGTQTSTTTPDPPALSGMVEGDFLVIAGGGSDHGETELTTEISGYNEAGSYNSAGAGGCFSTIMSKAVTGVTAENPGTYTIDQSEESITFTIAIKPGAVAGGIVVQAANHYINLMNG